MSTGHTVDDMLRIRLPAGPRRVQLKHSVDINIDRAFQDGMWAVVANLARNRHRTTKDEYYKVCPIESSSYLSVLASPISYVYFLCRMSYWVVHGRVWRSLFARSSAGLKLDRETRSDRFC